MNAETSQLKLTCQYTTKLRSKNCPWRSMNGQNWPISCTENIVKISRYFLNIAISRYFQMMQYIAFAIYRDTKRSPLIETTAVLWVLNFAEKFIVLTKTLLCLDSKWMFLPNYCFEGLRQKLPHLNYSSSDFLSLCMEQQVFSEQRESQRMEKCEGMSMMSMRVLCLERWQLKEMP